MNLTNWLIMLAAALLWVAFFCLRTRSEWSLENRARRRTGTRLIIQAVVASWGALLIIVHGADGLIPFIGRQYGPHYTPSALLFGALLLLALGSYWFVRGARLLRPRKLFTWY
jgi:predicted metal-binding membrane protein